MTQAAVLAQLGSTSFTPAFKNRIINGAFKIAQRGAGPTTTTGYSCVDRWAFNNAGSATTYSQISTTVNGITANAVQIAGATGNTAVNVYQRIESVNCYDLAGQNVTVSFWAYQSSGAASTVQVQAYYPSAADNYTSSTTITTQTFALATSTWTYITLTFAVPSGGANGLQIGFGPNSWGAWTSGNFQLAFVQLEKGTTATSFDYRPYGTELSLCQRYYQVATYTSGFYGASGNALTQPISNAVVMRVTPTAVVITAPTYTNGSTFAWVPSSAGYSYAGATVTATGATVVSGAVVSLSSEL
jgi:hypothetical protein